MIFLINYRFMGDTTHNCPQIDHFSNQMGLFYESGYAK